jgi:hypothetical protein
MGEDIVTEEITFFLKGLTEETVTAKVPIVPKLKREGRRDKKKLAVLRTNTIPSE